MSEPCTVQAWGARPAYLALAVVAGFALIVGMAVAADQTTAVEVAQSRG
jgi:hypothetical protein